MYRVKGFYSQMDKCNTDCSICVSTSKKIPKVLAFGNVLLDYNIELKNMDLLVRYNLSLNTRAEKDLDTINKIVSEVVQAREDDEDKGPHLGGSALNTVRIIKKLGTEPLFFGAIGDDTYAEVVRKLLNASILTPQLQEVADTPTGRCVCINYKRSLSLYANIGASSKFSKEFLMSIECDELSNFIAPIECEQIFYIEGFFVPQRAAAVTHIVRNYIKGGHYLALNLSADYIVQRHYFSILFLVRHAKFIIGNVDEFEALREFWGGDNLEELADGILNESTTSKILIITDGHRGGKIITNYMGEENPPGKITYKVFKASQNDRVIDTTGCGDAFAAGFFHAWFSKYPLDDCVIFASNIAAQVAGQIGCNLP